jgi:hypothetical protein
MPDILFPLRFVPLLPTKHFARRLWLIIKLLWPRTEARTRKAAPKLVQFHCSLSCRCESLCKKAVPIKENRDERVGTHC